MAVTENSSNPVGKPSGLKFIKAWYLLGALMLLLVGVVSLMPAPQVGVSDKVAHVLTYAVLGAWFGLLASNRLVLSWTVAGLLGYGIVLELLQGTTSYRFAEWADVVANGGGILIGTTLYFTPLKRFLAHVDQRLARFIQ
jgi:VanZ family protein